MLEIAFNNFQKHIDLTAEEKKVFESLIEILEIEKRSKILTIGQVCKYEYFVLKGCLRSYYFDDEAIGVQIAKLLLRNSSLKV